jgi:hypothetical protein
MRNGRGDGCENVDCGTYGQRMEAVLRNNNGAAPIVTVTALRSRVLLYKSGGRGRRQIIFDKS